MCRLIPRAQDRNPGLPHPIWVPKTQLHHPPRCVSQNRAPAARFLDFPPNHSPLASRLMVWAQDRNPGLPHPKWVPTTQLHHPPCCVSQNRAPAARFLVFPPHHSPLASCLMARAQDPNLGLPHPKWVPTTQLHPPPTLRSRKPSPHSSVLDF